MGDGLARELREVEPAAPAQLRATVNRSWAPRRTAVHDMIGLPSNRGVPLGSGHVWRVPAVAGDSQVVTAAMPV